MLEVSLRHAFKGFDLDLSFEAGPGITALFGRSGAGKTSVINAVAGLLRPQAGRVVLDGETLFDAQSDVWVPPHRRRMGYVFQDARLFPHLDVRDNLNFGARYAPRGSRGPGFDEVVALLGLGNLLTRAPATLSGGERQRVALGRAMLSHPRLLLMDEPLASLDGPRKQEILPYLERLRDSGPGVPILYVSHAVDEIARLADRLVLLQDGRVQRQGALFDVMADPEAVPLLGVREAGAVLEAEVVSHAEDGLSRLAIRAGWLELPGVEASVGARLRLRVLAQDILLSRGRPEGLSSRNVLAVRVTAVHHGAGPGAAVALDAGGDRLLARVTARAVQELELREGVDCYAILKATAVAPGDIGR